MISLPSLRSKIFRAFSLVLLLYSSLGVFLIVNIFTSGGTTPKVIHVNYDSIAAARQMEQAWNKISRQESLNRWKEPFEKALVFSEGNVTEPGEFEIVRALRDAWEKTKLSPTVSKNPDFQKIQSLLDQLVGVNEKGMFSTAQQNSDWSRLVFIISFIYFGLSLILSLLLADSIANRLSVPIKDIVEALHYRDEIGKKLKKIQPNSLEILILTTELDRLWKKVTENEKMNFREILDQRNKLDTVLESVEDALLVLDSQGRVTHINSYLLRLIELPQQEVVGKTWNDLSSLNENYLLLRGLFEEEMNHSHEIELNVDGKNRQFAARLRKTAVHGQETTGTVYLLHDITEKRQKEKFRAEFIDLLSHELKTPLQSLGTAVELLSQNKDQLPELLATLVETISEDVERIRGVANEFVQVTQSHSKILKLKLEKIALNLALKEWIKPFKVIAKDRNVSLNYIQEGSEQIYAQVDSVKFPWVISNLLSNAIRFSPEKSEVQLLVTDRNGAIEIQVQDEGPGIPESDEKRIFEPFFQSDQSETTTSTGRRGLFGIGLTIAKEVVEAHDGTIEYFRRPGRGAEFRIRLPFPKTVFEEYL